jgi:hypothetical protein
LGWREEALRVSLCKQMLANVERKTANKRESVCRGLPYLVTYYFNFNQFYRFLYSKMLSVRNGSEMPHTDRL